MKCEFCEDELEDIIICTSREGASLWLSHKEEAFLFVCTSADCKNRGVVICIPRKSKED